MFYDTLVFNIFTSILHLLVGMGGAAIFVIGAYLLSRGIVWGIDNDNDIVGFFQ